jgi:hypothetical protein
MGACDQDSNSRQTLPERRGIPGKTDDQGEINDEHNPQDHFQRLKAAIASGLHGLLYGYGLLRTHFFSA